MSDRHLDDDELIGLALGDVDELQRDSITSHLALCERCRADYAGIADTADHVLAAAPRVAPPPGFSKWVLDELGVAAPSRPVHAWRSPRALLVGVAAVLALLVGVGASVAILDRSPDPGSQVSQVAAVGPALVTRDGTRVGTVLDSWYDGEPILVVSLTQGPVGVRYDCLLVLADGTRQPGGSWVLDEPSGATWVIARPDADVTALELVTDAGSTWATATL